MLSVDDVDEVVPWRRRTRRPRRQLPLWQELPLLLIIAFFLAVLIRTFLVQAFFIPSGSMEDTLLVGDRVLVNKVVYDVREPRRGEIVVFRGTAAWAPQTADESDSGFLAKVGRTFGDLVGVGRPGEKDFIKRVIGLPGDRVRCCDAGRVTVNGVPLDESYVYQDSPLELPPDNRRCRSRQFTEVVVPPGQIFVMGDHRMVSQDARCQGPIPIENVIGRAFVVVWPYSRWSSLDIPQTFDKLSRQALPAPSTPDAPATPVDPQPSGGIALTLPILGFLPYALRSGQRGTIAHRRLQS